MVRGAGLGCGAGPVRAWGKRKGEGEMVDWAGAVWAGGPRGE
jgi:hypothetical protein